MIENLNFDKLREDLLDYYGTAMFNASPLTIIELTKVEKANNEELIEIAINNNFDLNEYKYYQRRKI